MRNSELTLKLENFYYFSVYPQKSQLIDVVEVGFLSDITKIALVYIFLNLENLWTMHGFLNSPLQNARVRISFTGLFLFNSILV